MRYPQSWGRVTRSIPSNVIGLSDRSSTLPSAQGVLAYGRGRSYGDVCLNSGGTLLRTDGLDRFIDFDRATGRLRCEAGVTLQDILSLVVPQGWFLAVTPGTRHVSIGGAIANDVHGKNHHAAGTFGHYVRCLELLRSNGDRVLCSVDQNAPLFAATIGGLGLTGLITWAEIQLTPIANPFMVVQTERFGNLAEFWAINREAETLWPYTVAWIDCLAKKHARGRGVFMAGRHAPHRTVLPVWREAKRRVPVDPPLSLINGVSLRAFNLAYWSKARDGQRLSHYVPYFYPLDAIAQWNRIYGHAGFFQYQCVLPPTFMREGIDALLERIAKSGQGSFLAVLKTFGDRPSVGLLSFPRPGATLALDFPNRGEATKKLFVDLDSIVKEAGGAIYPAKDAHMSPELFRHAFPRLDEFMKLMDPGFMSDFWRRVMP